MAEQNNAAMREALLKASDVLTEAAHHNLTEEYINECLALIHDALTAPPRNCDRFSNLRSAQRDYIDHGCPKGLGFCVDGEIRKFPWKSQFEKWLFATAEEKEVSND